MTTGENTTSGNVDRVSANAHMHIKYNYPMPYTYTLHTQHTQCLKTYNVQNMYTSHPSCQGVASLHVALTFCLIGIGVPDKAHGVVSPRICRTQAF